MSKCPWVPQCLECTSPLVPSVHLDGWNPLKIQLWSWKKFRQYFQVCLWFNCNKWWKQIWKSLQWNLPTQRNFEKRKYFTHKNCFSRPSSLYKWGPNANILISIKESPAISILWDLRIKVALYHQKCFLQPLVQKYFKSVELLSPWYNLLKHLRFFYIKRWGKGQIL